MRDLCSFLGFGCGSLAVLFRNIVQVVMHDWLDLE
jgi:hypothetical protein